MGFEITFFRRNFVRNIHSLIETLSDSFIVQFSNDDPVITREAQLILDNPVDKFEVDKAVQELKKNRKLKSKKIILSNKEEVTLSVH